MFRGINYPHKCGCFFFLVLSEREAAEPKGKTLHMNETYCYSFLSAKFPDTTHGFYNVIWWITIRILGSV